MRESWGDKVVWTIDQNDSGRYFIEYNFKGQTHTSEGVGDGIWSVFTICDALYDAKENDTIVIDEPELSIHPAIQKRLLYELLEQSKDKQIIIATHSPYFISWDAITNGAVLVRTVKKEDGNIHCYSLGAESKTKLNGLIADVNNPHVLGIQANETFFLEDRIILVEGQEDVVIFRKILTSEAEGAVRGNFFGWGAGGASKIPTFLKLFRDLGYEKVVAVFDGDKSDEKTSAEKEYPNYHFFILPTDDIRDKEARIINEKCGITNSSGELKAEHKPYIDELVKAINETFI